jgi:hypothetical protein
MDQIAEYQNHRKIVLVPGAEYRNAQPELLGSKARYKSEFTSTIHAAVNRDAIFPDCSKFGYFRRSQIIQNLPEFFSSFWRLLYSL